MVQEQLQGQLSNVNQVFSELWPHVEAHYPQLPPDVTKTSLVVQAFHLWIVYNGLHRENQELHAALAARPALPNPEIVYSTQVAAKQGQAAQMQATLTSTVPEAYDLLKSLQECSLALTVKTQSISAQLQQISMEIQETADLVQLDQLYAQADELEVQIQQTEANSAAAKRVIRELRSPIQSSARSMQQLAAEAENQLNTMFGAVPVHIEEADVTKIAEETDSLMQGWQQAVSAFTKLRATTFCRVLELGPLFEQPPGGAQ